MAEDLITIDGPGGRTLRVLTAGPPDGRTLLFHNGTPGGLVAFGPMIDAASARGLRTVMYARPGYAGSAPCPGRSVADAAADAGAVLDALGAGPFVTAGWSGGGPHALACAALLPERCLAAATIAGVAPYAAEGLDWLAGMGPENHEEFAAALAGPEALTAYLSAAAAPLAAVTGDAVAAELGGLASEADQAVMTGEFAGYLAASFRDAVSGGVAGWRDDDVAFTRDWGFSLPEGASWVPVSLWQGGEDRMVPAGHGRWLASRMPGARAHLLDDEGHLTLVTRRYGDILDELVALAG